MDDTYAPPDTPLDVLHDDAEMLVVSKPSGLLSVPGKGEHLSDCLIARVQAVWPQALLVHRLKDEHVREEAAGDAVGITSTSSSVVALLRTYSQV